MKQVFNKKLYSLSQLFKFIEDNVFMIWYKSGNKIDKGLEKKIKLVVTEVNGCELCTYGHTASALKSGLAEKDIQIMLSGNLQGVSEEEGVALFFAQHYADSAGSPSEEAWNRLLNRYGEEKSRSILSSIRSIMIGNTVGIALGAFKSRTKGNSFSKSSLAYELSIMLNVIPFHCIALFSSLLKKCSSKSYIQFT